MLRKAVPPPDDPTIRRKVSELRRRLHKTRALATIGHLGEVRAGLDALAVEAEITGYAPVQGEVLTARGHILMFSGETEAAEQALEEAQLIAEAEGYDGLIVETLLWMAALNGTRRNAFDDAHRQIRRARAVLQRMGQPGQLLGTDAPDHGKAVLAGAEVRGVGDSLRGLPGADAASGARGRLGRDRGPSPPTATSCRRSIETTRQRK